MVQVLVVSMDLNRVHHLTGQLLRVLPALKVRSVRSLAEAAELARAMSFRVAFVDLALAGEGLPVVVGSLRQSLENRFLPVVLVGREDRTAEGAAPASRQVAADGEGDVGAQRAGNDGDDWRLAGDGLYAALGVACLPFPFDAEVLRRLAEVIFAEAGARDLRQGRRIFLDQAGAARWINEDEIVFVEYVARRVVIHLRKEVIEYKYMPLSMFARQLSAQFVQVHQSYVVNVQAVRGFDRRLGVLRLAGLAQPVPVGRSYQRRVVELLRGKLEE